MKFSLLQHQTRRASSFRSASAPPPLDDSTATPTTTTTTTTKPSASTSSANIFWLILHGLCCLISLILGFRFSRLVFLFLFTSTTFHTSQHHTTPTNLEIRHANATSVTSSFHSRVVVGRHGIRIRPWPHPNPTEVMKAYRIIERVQREQRVQFGVKSPMGVVVITPTYVRTFQGLHLSGVMHSLMLVPYDVVWVVVEAGGVSNETAGIIGKSGLRCVHVGYEEKMPSNWEDRHRVEARMRVRGLRVVREQKLDGIVMFADDSNMHSMELFDEIQNVKWFGAVSVGILAHSSGVDQQSVAEKEGDEKPSLPIQGPACNASDQFVGWHTFNSEPYRGKHAVHIDDRAVVLPRKFEWSGFVLNSRLVWKEAEDKPEWVKDLDSIDDDIESPLSLLKDPSVVEPLGSCGRQVMIWWLRVEARADSKFPRRWVIDPPLEITVPSKRTPWPDAPPELPSVERLAVTQERAAKRPPKTRSSRSRRSSRKRKQDAKMVDSQINTRHFEHN